MRITACAPPSRCSILNSRRPTASRPRSWKAPTTTFAGSTGTAKCGCRAEQVEDKSNVADIHYTNALPKKPVPGQGEVTEVLNQALCGAKNVLGSLRWLQAADTFKAAAADKH